MYPAELTICRLNSKSAIGVYLWRISFSVSGCEIYLERSLIRKRGELVLHDASMHDAHLRSCHPIRLHPDRTQWPTGGRFRLLHIDGRRSWPLRSATGPDRCFPLGKTVPGPFPDMPRGYANPC